MYNGEDSYISEIPNSNVFHPSKSSLIFNSNSEVPDTFKDFVKFNEKLNEVEMDLKKVLPEKLGFIEEKFFEIPSFRFDFDKNCNEILVFLQFYDNQKCMVTVSLDSGNNFILETSFGTISISKNDLLKTKFFADSSMIYSITEFGSYLMPKFESIILCEIYSTEILPYFKITNTKSNSKCLKSKIIFGGSLTNEKMSLFVSEKEKKFSSWLEALPYIGVLCGLLFIGTASFFVYCCIRNHRKKKNKTLKEKQKLLAKLPTAKDEKDLEPNTLSEIIDKEIEGKEIQQKPKTFKVIVPAVEKNISNNKSCLGERE
uniref:Uncharacterized protein n=1 Tax=Panagrolaimus sp. PS1159 TaxID=55785 RepID=A0AC35GQM3_9BILA